MTYNIARKAARVEIYKKEKSEKELKSYDYEIQQQAISITGSTYAITTPIATGTGYNERVGAQVNVQSVFMRYTISNADTSNIVRIIVYRWMDPSIPTAAFLQVLPTSATIHPLSPINYDSRKRINILYDQTIVTDSDDPIKIEKVFLVKKFPVSWVVADTAQRGQLYVTAISDSVAAPHPVLHALVRVKYFDS